MVQGWFCGCRGVGVESDVEFIFGQGGGCTVRRPHVDLTNVVVCIVVLEFGEWWWCTTWIRRGRTVMQCKGGQH